MNRKKRGFPIIIALSLVAASIMVAVSSFVAAADTGVIEETPANVSIHEKVDISEITGEIAEPPELTSAASALAQEKEWYEYIYYSEEPVGYYYLSNNTRISFYDPYDYSNSLVMEVDDCITDWSSNNSLQISYTTGDSLSNTEGKSTETTTSTQIAVNENGDRANDVSITSGGKSTVITTVEGKINTYNESKKDAYTDSHDYWGLSEVASTEGEAGLPTIASMKIGLEIGATQNWGWDHHGEQRSEDSGYTEDNTTTTSKTTTDDTIVTSKIADRFTKASGKSDSSAITMSTNNSTTITKTYDAGYFNASGAPLQWKIVKYTVKMPMYYQVEYLVDGEWVFGDSSYCILNTVQGTCRAWLENNTAYYEHWGTGEKVTWDEFWSMFFTKESLIEAYKDKLYPD